MKTKNNEIPDSDQDKDVIPLDPNPTLSSFTSLTLLGKVRDLSNQEAWEEFVRRYTPRIFSWCKRFSLQDQDASDVTQQVLMKLVSTMQSFEYDQSRGTFRGWLRTVTSNTVRDLGRKKSSKELTGKSAGPWLEKLNDKASIDFLAQQIEEGYREELLVEAEARAQLRIKPRNWKAYELLTKEDMPVAKVAETLGMKIADVYVAKSRAVKMLREIVIQLESLN